MSVGLTGGVATGKSTVSRMLQQRGAAIIDADQAARDVVEPGTAGSNRVRARFGSEVFHPDGTLNRKALGAVVFRDESARKDLNRILHPLIVASMQEAARRIREQEPGRIVVMDTPLLLEENLTSLVERVIVVYVSESIQIKRLMARENIDEESAWRMIRSQMPIEEKKRFADVIIDNSGTLADTERQVDELWGKWLSENGSDLL
ncbi:dephospho-CoA kinase [Paludifilum halophilum]|uniref:Dephospho-CoA kinase n=1 Tax=Paludifilum halophilum TaxID=1642702 RepID=A0A235B800_9BACL|nr:dephospho-CoA kinase [Paludifilum halophilum]OYD08381.1 dephospho-CoA kinase [Paludifilum halophilum]